MENKWDAYPLLLTQASAESRLQVNILERMISKYFIHNRNNYVFSPNCNVIFASIPWTTAQSSLHLPPSINRVTRFYVIFVIIYTASILVPVRATVAAICDACHISQAILRPCKGISNTDSVHFSSLFRFPSILLPPFPLQSSGVLYTWMMIVIAPLPATKTSGWGTYSEEAGGKYNLGRHEEPSSIVIPTTLRSHFRSLSIVETAFYFHHSSSIVRGNIIYLLLLLLLLLLKFETVLPFDLLRRQMTSAVITIYSMDVRFPLIILASIWHLYYMIS